jgi:glycine/D-amino acid oxidase-like deaminating enzyme|tara:strand:- start:2468 stop:3739 length:1272 start_codon:yes stop_codon:yes gene_type:complete
MKTDVFWTDQFPRPNDLSVANELPSQVDVAIVGSGYTGLNCARVLAKDGRSVVVLDQHSIGWGASSRNGGMATPGLKQDIFKIKKTYGMEYAKEFWKSSVDAINLLELIIREENIDCDWERNGHCSLAFKQSHFNELPEYADWLKMEMGHEKTIVPKEKLKSEIGTDEYFGGISDESSAGLHPAKYVFGLAKSVENLGVSLFEKTRVDSINRTSNGFELITKKGKLNSKDVVIATNGYTDTMVPGMKPKVFPVGSYIIVSEPLPADLQHKLSPKKRMFYDSKNFLNYFRLTPDGRMLWGGRNDLSTDLDLNESASILTKQVCTIFPELNDVKFTNSWTGKLGITFDLMPHIGQTNGIHYALGYGGHGLSIATYLGTEIGLLMTGQKNRSPYEEIPHQTMFFYKKNPWFLPFAAKWYQFLDWIS